MKNNRLFILLILIVLSVPAYVFFKIYSDHLNIMFFRYPITQNSSVQICDNVLNLNRTSSFQFLNFINVNSRPGYIYSASNTGSKLNSNFYYFSEFDLKGTHSFSMRYQIVPIKKENKSERDWFFNLNEYKIYLNAWSSQQICLNESVGLLGAKEIDDQQIQSYDGEEVTAEKVIVASNVSLGNTKLFYFAPATLLLLKSLKGSSYSVLGATLLESSEVVDNKILYPKTIEF